MLTRVALLACLAAVCAAKPLVARSMQLHEVRDEVPDGFVHSGAAPQDTVLNLRLALVQSDTEGLQKALMDVSTPSSALYGQHLTKEEVRRAAYIGDHCTMLTLRFSGREVRGAVRRQRCCSQRVVR